MNIVRVKHQGNNKNYYFYNFIVGVEKGSEVIVKTQFGYQSAIVNKVIKIEDFNSDFEIGSFTVSCINNDIIDIHTQRINDINKKKRLKKEALEQYKGFCNAVDELNKVSTREDMSLLSDEIIKIAKRGE